MAVNFSFTIIHDNLALINSNEMDEVFQDLAIAILLAKKIKENNFLQINLCYRKNEIINSNPKSFDFRTCLPGVVFHSFLSAPPESLRGSTRNIGVYSHLYYVLTY